MMMSTAFLWHRTVSSCVIYIAGQRPASAASSAAAAGTRAQLETSTASMETQNRGFLWDAVFMFLIRLNHSMVITCAVALVLAVTVVGINGRQQLRPELAQRSACSRRSKDARRIGDSPIREPPCVDCRGARTPRAAQGGNQVGRPTLFYSKLTHS